MSQAFMQAVAARRSVYTLSKDTTIPDSQIVDLVKQTLHTVPSAFGMEATRIVVALNKEHDKVWNIVAEVLKGMLPPDQYEQSMGRINGFKAAHGTLLFYEDTATTQATKEKFSPYKDKVDQWSEHGAGMHQFTLWTALELEGLGCNLQHYNPLLDQKVAEAFDVPATWTLNSQLVFGKPTAPSQERVQKKPFSETLKVFGAE